MRREELIGCAHTMEKLAIDMDPELALALLGAGGGGTLAYMGTRDPNQKIRNALFGAGAGGLIGYGAGKAIGSGSKGPTLVDKVKSRVAEAGKKREGLQAVEKMTAETARKLEALRVAQVPFQAAALNAAVRPGLERMLTSSASGARHLPGLTPPDPSVAAGLDAYRGAYAAGGAPGIPTPIGGTAGAGVLGGISGEHPGSLWESVARAVGR